jgi:hypothetical protein
MVETAGITDIMISSPLDRKRRGHSSVLLMQISGGISITP